VEGGCAAPRSDSDLAKALSLDPATVTRITSPSKAIPEVVAARKAGKFGLSTVYAVTRQPDQAAALALKLSGASRDQVEANGRKARKAGGGSGTVWLPRPSKPRHFPARFLQTVPLLYIER
jgi:hypothetical protein